MCTNSLLFFFCSGNCQNKTVMNDEFLTNNIIVYIKTKKKNVASAISKMVIIDEFKYMKTHQDNFLRK